MNNLVERTKKMKNRKGFTLIELIVVIVIIGILAAIVIPRLGGFSSQAKATAAEAGAKTICTAMSTIYASDPTTGDAAVEALDDDATTIIPLTDLTGPLTGTLTGVTCVNGDIGFTYTEGGWVVVYVDSALDSTTAE